MKRDFLRLWDLNTDEILQLIERAVDLKKGIDSNKCPLINKSVGLLFEKPSTRTRVSFEVGIYQMGGHPVYMTPSEIQLGRGETISDTAKVLSKYLNGIVIRTYDHNRIVSFAKSADIPVINGLSNLHHPCQALADLMTIKEKKGTFLDIKVTYIGDGNNVANSLIEAAAKIGFSLIIACPEGYEPNADVVQQAREYNSEIIIIKDPKEAVANADVIYTDVWISMGQENESQKRRQRFKEYQLNQSLLECSKKDVIIMHCLPAHRGEEITDDVIDGHNSVVFDQAENRLHTQKSLLEFLIKNTL